MNCPPKTCHNVESWPLEEVELYIDTVLNVRLFDWPCWPRIYLTRKMKVEPDLRLVMDMFSVRYKCYQSLEIHVS